MLWIPPDWSLRFATDDLDEANASQSAYGWSRRRCVGRGPLRLVAERVYLESAAIGWSRTATGQVVEAESAVPILHLPLGGALTYRVGNSHVEVRPGQAALVAAGTRYKLGYDGGQGLLAIVMPSSFMDCELRARGRQDDWRGILDLELPKGGVGRRRLEAMLGELHAAPAVTRDGPAAAHFATRLAEWCAGLAPPVRDRSASQVGAAERLRKVEEWIDANLAEPISLGRLCAVAGVEESGLRKSFRQRRGVSPMQWVWARRMAAVRLRLLEARPGESVIFVGHECGLNHAGRLSVDYRRRYGEPPSRTLARALMRA